MEEFKKSANFTNVYKYAISSKWRFANENQAVVGTLTQLLYIYTLVPVLREANQVQGLLFFANESRHVK